MRMPMLINLGQQYNFCINGTFEANPVDKKGSVIFC
jgi:hypothetical protein